MSRWRGLNDGFNELYRKLDYRFADPALLQRALTHRSKSSDNNERLEFLGDSVLSVVVSAQLYAQFPQLTEGELTRVRASLVRQDTLAGLARVLDLGRWLFLGGGEYKSGGYDRDSILADAFEAVLGAVFVEAGFDAVRRVVLALYRDLLERIDPLTVVKDPKTRLQEYLQKRAVRTPIYSVLSVTGDPHQQSFTVECAIPDLHLSANGEGSSRRYAEQQAAERALALLTAQS